MDWIERYRPEWIGQIQGSCFFCQYDNDQVQISLGGWGSCLQCPAILIDPKFHCSAYSYNYENRPFQFYWKVSKLYRKFLRQERERCNGSTN